MKNYIVDLNETSNFIELDNAIGKHTMTDNNGYYKVYEYYLCYINNSPCAVYRNKKGYTHIIIMEKSKVQNDYLLKSSELKFQNSFFSTPKQIIDKAINNNLFFNKAIIENINIG